MSPKLGRDHRADAEASSAHTAASREEPQPKFSAATRIFAAAERGLVEHELGALALVLVEAHVVEEEVGVAGLPRGLRRKRAGMIRSVSTLGRSIGAATAVSVREGLHRQLPPAVPHVGEAAGDRGGRRHRRAHQVRARALCPGGPRSCGWRSRRSARPRAPCRRSCRRTSSSPGSRHSKPASGNTRSSPSASAACLTSPEPGTTQRRDHGAPARAPPPQRRGGPRCGCSCTSR